MRSSERDWYTLKNQECPQSRLASLRRCSSLLITLSSVCVCVCVFPLGLRSVTGGHPLHTSVLSALSCLPRRYSAGPPAPGTVALIFPHICVPARLTPVSMPATGSALSLSSVSLTGVSVKLSSLLRAAEPCGPSRQELPP